MPTVLVSGPYRFFFFSNEGGEPPHVHVRRGNQLAKYWLQPVALAASTNFASHELREVRGIVFRHQVQFLEAWNEYFGR
jgi:hypothetical protein